jgi:hypothetical protein
MSAETWFKREVRHTREYVVKREADGIIDEAREDLSKCGSGGLEFGNAIGGLEDLAGWYGAKGCVAVLDGDMTGYELVDRACLYRFWAIQLLARAYDLDERPNKGPRGLLVDQIARCWMHAEAMGVTAIRESLDALIVRVDSGYGGVSGRQMNALGTLVAHYATNRDARSLERDGWAPIGTYRAATTNNVTERDYEAFASYHQRNLDGSGFPAFHSDPYRLAALELLAIARRTGVPVSGQHPLITSPLARARDVETIAVPDELQPVLAVARDLGL